MLIFPITYLYIIIPAAVGIAVIMVLVRYVPSKVLFGILTVFNMAMVALWIYFVIGDQSILLERLLVLAENLEGVYDYLVPLESAAGMAAVLMGVGEGFFAGLGWLLLSVSLVLGLAVLVIQRVYYQGYERLQVAVPRKKKKKGAVRQLPGQGPISALVGSKWKIVFRNFEMGQAALGLFSLLLAYGVAMYIADPPAKELVMLFNVVVVHFLASWTVGVFFVPAEFLQDRSILKQIYWIFKVTPVSGKVVVRGFYLAVTILSLLLSFMVLVAINLVLGVEAAYWGMSLVLLAMLQLPGGMLDLLVEFQQLGLGAGEAPLVFRILKGAMPFLYAGLFIVLAGFGLYYRYLGFLSFLHHLPEETAFYGGLLAFVALALMVLLASYNMALRCWDNLEI